MRVSARLVADGWLLYQALEYQTRLRLRHGNVAIAVEAVTGTHPDMRR